ncbi:MAG: membrane dipeptidase, partial [Hyphomicrobiaceae bacterium]
MTTAEATGAAEHVATPDTRRFHDDIFVFDGLAIAYVLEEKYTERCQEGGVNAANVTFALEENWDDTLRQTESYLTTIEKRDDLRLCLTASDLVAAKEAGQIGIVFGTQGASMLEGQLDRLDILVRLGLRILGVAYTTANEFGDGCGEKRDAGLSYLGEELVEAANELPIMLDLSHCGHRTRADTTALAYAPVCTH